MCADVGGVGVVKLNHADCSGHSFGYSLTPVCLESGHVFYLAVAEVCDQVLHAHF